MSSILPHTHGERESERPTDSNKEEEEKCILSFSRNTICVIQFTFNFCLRNLCLAHNEIMPKFNAMPFAPAPLFASIMLVEREKQRRRDNLINK